MSASGSTQVIERLPWPPASAVQFPPEPGLNVRRAFQSPDKDTPSFANQIEPVPAAPAEITFGPFRLLATQFLLLEGNSSVPIGSRALEILIALLERPGELVSKQEMMDRVWPNVFVEPANLTVHISALRRALRDGRDGNRFIINIPGRGYKFVGTVAASHHQKSPVAIVSRTASERRTQTSPDGGVRNIRAVPSSRASSF